MGRGYQRLSPAVEGEIWARLRAGHAAKPTARALGLSTSGVRATWCGVAGSGPLPTAFAGPVEPGRAGGDLEGSGGRAVAAGDRGGSGSCRLDGQP